MKKKLIGVIISAAVLIFTIVTLAFAEGGMLGDMDDNGKIEASDARTILRISAQLEKPADDNHAKRADTNKDGRITAADARLTLRVSAKLDKFEEDTTKEPTSDEEPSSTTPENPTETEPPVIKYPAVIDAFFSGNYYLEGSLGDSSKTAVKMAVKNGDFEVVMTDKAPASISVAKLGEKKYIKAVNAKGEKMYTELTKDISEFISKFEPTIKIDSLFDDMKINAVEKIGDPIVDKNGDTTIYTFTIKDGTAEFTVTGSDVTKIVVVVNDKAPKEINVTELAAKAPSDILTIDGFTEKTILEIADAFN